MPLVNAVLDALAMAGSMAWEILWSLVLGFFLSAAVEAVVRKDTVTRLMGDDRPRSLAAATALGAASSSCSYAAVAWRDRCSARALTSPPRWPSRSPPPTWSSRWA